MELSKEDLVFLGKFFFGDKPVKRVSVTYSRNFFSKLRIDLVLEDGSEKFLRVYITRKRILIF